MPKGGPSGRNISTNAAGTPAATPSGLLPNSTSTSSFSAATAGSGKVRPKSAYVNGGAGDPTADEITSPTSSEKKPLKLGGGGSIRRPRPVSAEIHRGDNRVSPVSSIVSSNSDNNTAGAGGDNNQLMLLMYIIGGREVGQVTVFKRPISIWRLDLTKTF